MTTQKATREEGQTLLNAFIPSMGSHYERSRNVDLGPGEHRSVSQLSPYVRRRLVLESEVIQAALNTHGPVVSEKFIQEVFWRSYFKGWLELRPTVWNQYRCGLAEDLSALETNLALRARVAAAESGRTGLECFDAWVNELVTTGYLHNHARMWFASIWIFTLKLPWRIGADFFYRYLLDGDAASNTLSWRWVAGLHTRGKAYSAEGW
ncbi:MAG: FAD-binding domain-containing protein, partial [Burkholderiaceae bacterium]